MNKLNHMEKHMIKMQHKAHRLRVILERFDLSVIDENVYDMANNLNDMQVEIANTYDGMEVALNYQETIEKRKAKWTM